MEVPQCGLYPKDSEEPVKSQAGERQESNLHCREVTLAAVWKVRGSQDKARDQQDAFV